MDGEVIRYGGGYYNGKNKDILGKEFDDWSAEINASRNGVSINGTFPIYKSREPIDRIIETLNKAWDDHERLRK